MTSVLGQVVVGPAVTQVRSSHIKAPPEAFISASVGVRLRRQLTQHRRCSVGRDRILHRDTSQLPGHRGRRPGFSTSSASGGEINTQPGPPGPCRHQADRLPFRPACSPTRAMLLTGTDHHVAGIGTMLEMAAPGFRGAPATRVSERPGRGAAELLRDAGYQTLMSGKWHLGNTIDRSPWARDSTVLRVAAGRRQPLRHPRRRWVVSRADDVHRRRSVRHGGGGLLLVGCLHRHAAAVSPRTPPGPGGPALLRHLPFQAPHWPLHAPRETIAAYHGRYDVGPDALREERLAALTRLVCAHPTSSRTRWSPTAPGMGGHDRRGARRLCPQHGGLRRHGGQDGLEHRPSDRLPDGTGELDNTVVIFLSDNGAEGTIEANSRCGPGNRGVRRQTL